jgi:hypothetical protein
MVDDKESIDNSRKRPCLNNIIRSSSNSSSSNNSSNIISNNTNSSSRTAPLQEKGDRGGLRVDVRIVGLEESTVVTDVDVRCLYPDARSYASTPVEKLLENDEKEKRDRYQQAVQAEGHRFRPFVVSTDGVLGPSAMQLMNKISDKLADKL